MGKLYEQTKKLPVDPETNKTISLIKYANKLIESEAFSQSLMSKKEPGKLMKPTSIAKLVKDPEKLKAMMDQTHIFLLAYIVCL